jgi:hypothetical protein
MLVFIYDFINQAQLASRPDKAIFRYKNSLHIDLQ